MLRLPPVPCQSVSLPHPFDHETATLRVRGNRRRQLNFEGHIEPHFLAPGPVGGPEHDQ
jgi:hypothetical protein